MYYEEKKGEGTSKIQCQGGSLPHSLPPRYLPHSFERLPSQVPKDNQAPWYEKRPLGRALGEHYLLPGGNEGMVRSVLMVGMADIKAPRLGSKSYFDCGVVSGQSAPFPHLPQHCLGQAGFWMGMSLFLGESVSTPNHLS